MGLRIGKGKVSRYDARREDRNSLWFYIQNGGKFTGLSKVNSFDSYIIPSDFKSITSLQSMFNGCTELTSVEINVPSCTSLYNVFRNCTSLKSVVISGTSKVYDFGCMLHNASDLKEINDIDMSSAEQTYYMFYNCHGLESVNFVNMSSVLTDAQFMFYNCYRLRSVSGLALGNGAQATKMFYNCWKLTSLPPAMFSSGKLLAASYMFYECNNLVSVPDDIDTSSVSDMTKMFGSCYKLKSIPALDASKAVVLTNIFQSCYSLEEIHMTGMKVSFSISASTKFTREALVEIIGNLAEVTSTQTLTMGSTNLAKLTDDDKAVATGKGWTLK